MGEKKERLTGPMRLLDAAPPSFCEFKKKMCEKKQKLVLGVGVKKQKQKK